MSRAPQPRPGQNLSHWREIDSKALINGGPAQVPTGPRRTWGPDQQAVTGLNDPSKHTGGVSPFATGAKRKALTDLGAAMKRRDEGKRGLPNPMERKPLRTNVPIPLARIPFPGDRLRMSEMIPSVTTHTNRSFHSQIVDNVTTTGVRNPDISGFLTHLQQGLPVFADRLHPSAIRDSKITVALTVDQINDRLFEDAHGDPSKRSLSTRDAVMTRFVYLGGFLDEVTVGGTITGRDPLKSLATIQYGGDTNKPVYNIWFRKDRVLREGAALFLVLVRKTTKIRDQTATFWRFEPYVSENVTSLQRAPPASAYMGVTWEGAYIPIGYLGTMNNKERGFVGSLDAIIDKTLYRAEMGITTPRVQPKNMATCVVTLCSQMAYSGEKL